jgi:large subunit ribosomal protein L20
MRTKTGVIRRKRHKKILSLAKGYWMKRSKAFSSANQAVLHAGQYAFHGRKRKKRDLRQLWIVRLNAALRQQGLKYSLFINQLKKKDISLNRKMLSQLALKDPSAFQKLLDFVK